MVTREEARVAARGAWAPRRGKRPFVFRLENVFSFVLIRLPRFLNVGLFRLAFSDSRFASTNPETRCAPLGAILRMRRVA